jgi:simple sugar transport system ATP-binding protein
MVGRSELIKPAERAALTSGNIRLRIDAVCADDDRGARAVSNLSLMVRSGEIVGIAGVSGNGQRELVEVLAGQREATHGAVLAHGEPYRATREEIRRQAVFCIPEEPLHNACVRRMSVAENLALREFDRPPFVSGRWFVNRRAMREAAQRLISRYRIVVPGPDAPAEVLSGGNVQRMVLARDLSGPVEVLIVANPCFGLDIASTAEIRAQIMQLRNRGTAVLLVSEDLDELFELADRVLVMLSGRIVYETPVAQTNRATLGRYMVGH